jgi:hypothetical protein
MKRTESVEERAERVEHRTEADIAVELAALRADIAELQRRTSADVPPPADVSLPAPAADSVRHAIEEYRRTADAGQWRARAEVDKWVIGAAVRIPFYVVQDIYRANASDKATQVATAVILGAIPSADDDKPIAALLAEILASPFAHARHRAALAAYRRMRRGDVADETVRILGAAVNRAIRGEENSQVRDALMSAQAAASAMSALGRVEI